MEQQTKYCPFRCKDGEFAQCYGVACMAYYEYDRPIIDPNAGFTKIEKYDKIPCCHKISIPVNYNYVPMNYCN